MAAKKAQSKVSDSQTLNELKTHQKECTLRYERIEERLNEGSEKWYAQQLEAVTPEQE